MIIDLRQELRVIPKPAGIPCCRVDKVGPYGLFFARRPGISRCAPAFNYLEAMNRWREMALSERGL
jgi:hypothetical protein